MIRRGDATDRPVVVVTGGSRGIGRHIVARLASDGFAVLFTYTSSVADAFEVGEACRNANLPVWGLQLDITGIDAPRVLFDCATARGNVVGLVNNAARTGPLGPLAALGDDELRCLVDTNFTAPIRLCREAVRRWSDGQPGDRRDIVNISSTAARTGSPGEYVAYAATKGAVDTFTVGLAREVARTGIRVNAVSPGTTETGIHARAGDANRASRVGSSVPIGRAAKPQEIAAAVSWLLSVESSYAIGTVLEVAGGG